VRIATHEMRSRADVDTAFAFAREQPADALLVLSSPFVGGNTKLFAERCLAQRLPAMTLFPDFARDGGLMAYGPNLLAFFRQQGILTSKILRGQSPADLPIETPTRLVSVAKRLD
jgi:putative tryptophan/tyrosine transport system substrate-binding protein